MSIRIEYDTLTGQTILLTLSESLTGDTSLTGLSFYFVFINEQTKVELTKTLTDNSLYPSRYNDFSISTSLTITGATNIPFAIEGFYTYKAYDFNGGTLLEIGKCYINDNSTPSITSYNRNVTNYVYNRNV